MLLGELLSLKGRVNIPPKRSKKIFRNPGIAYVLPSVEIEMNLAVFSSSIIWVLKDLQKECFDGSLIENPVICESAVTDYVNDIRIKGTLTNECKIACLLRAITCLDLTTLAGDDSESNVACLCNKATEPIQKNLLEKLGTKKGLEVAAVCVYPAQVANCKKTLCSLDSNIPIASVATGFPSGQYHLETRLQEIQLAMDAGATEIDIVINRDLALCGKWEEIYKEVKAMRDVCGKNAVMKTILATGELGSLSNIYIASIVCMMAGADFIKTSTGKEAVNATLPVGVVMARAIKDYFRITGYKVGLKPAGGLKTVTDVLSWQNLMKVILGNDWLMPDLFRIGASSLLGSIENYIYKYVSGYDE